MKKTRLFMLSAVFCGATLFFASCNSGGGGDDHATQDENSIETEETENTGEMQDDISEDTTTMGGDTATTM